MANPNVVMIREPDNSFSTAPQIPRPPTQIRTFDATAESYLSQGGDHRYLPKIIEHFRGRPLDTIYPFDIREMAMELYPDHLNSTRNRQAITPTRSVLIHGYERGWCQYVRVKKFKEEPPKRKKPATAMWLHAFVRQCDKDEMQHVAAIVLFMSQTGARVSEAVALRWAEVDLQSRKALLLKTKTGINSMRYLTDELVSRLHALAVGHQPQDRVFGYGCRYAVNERLKAICKRADISYKSSHVCGRHTFATSAMDMGMDIRTAMEAGDWKSSKVFLETYVHPRSNSGRMVADRFNSMQFDRQL